MEEEVVNEVKIADERQVVGKDEYAEQYEYDAKEHVHIPEAFAHARDESRRLCGKGADDEERHAEPERVSEEEEEGRERRRGGERQDAAEDRSGAGRPAHRESYAKDERGREARVEARLDRKLMVALKEGD